MSRGPKRKDELRRLQAGSSPAFWENWEFPVDTPEPTRVEFARLVEDLKSVGCYHRSHPVLVLEAARLRLRLDEADREVREKGMIVPSHRGTLANPMLAYANATATRLRLLYAEMGLTPSSFCVREPDDESEGELRDLLKVV